MLVEQLIVGVLLFTPLLGLLPTSAAWYFSVTVLHAVLAGTRTALCCVAVGLRSTAVPALLERWVRPDAFPGELTVWPLAPAAAVAVAQGRPQNVDGRCDAAGGVAYYYALRHLPLRYAQVLQSCGDGGGICGSSSRSSGCAPNTVGTQLMDVLLRTLSGRTWGLSFGSLRCTWPLWKAHRASASDACS